VVEQQVIDRVDRLPCEQILQLLRALLSSRASSQAVCVLAGNLARNFGGLQQKQRWQLQQLAVAAFHQAGLQFPPDEETLYSWCLALAVKTPELAHGCIDEALGVGPLSMMTVGSPEFLKLQDSLVAKVDVNDNDSTLSIEPGEFSYQCRLASFDSLPNFPSTPEDSDDEYYVAPNLPSTPEDSDDKYYVAPNFPSTPEDSDDEYYVALVAQQANEVHSMNSPGGVGVASSNVSLGTSPCMSADGVGMLPVAAMQPYWVQM
jgi:hypothetical protein